MDRLLNVFRLDSFRHNQLEAINATLSGKDVFVLMPTGGGKSLCYQVPAVCEGGTTRGVTVVVSPLIALMIDQVHHLEDRGIDVVLFNSDQGQDSSREARFRLTGRGPKPKLLYVTPEKLHKSNDMRSILAKLYHNGELARFVIDEAHCVSTWGRDFREAYQDLDRLRQDYPKIPIIALTATANEQVMNDVIDRLGIKNCVLLTQSFNRPNLHYEIRTKRKNVLADINAFIQSNHRGQTGIIYCFSRNKCEEVAKELRDKYGLKAKHYHAQMSVEDKSKAQIAWQSNECDIIVATVAFGMGIDISTVRYVIHYSLPMSMDGYYQETGRAGRDGKPATCILFYTYGDTNILFKLIQDNEKTTFEERKRQEGGVRTVVQYCQNKIDCRRVQVLGYFGQAFDSKACQKRCDNCLDSSGSSEEDMTEVAVQAIRLVKDLLNREKNVTKLHCLDVFRGANTKAIRDRGHNHVELFGAGSSLTREQCERLFDHLLSLEGFRQISVPNKSGWNNLYMQVRTMDPFI
ncbi:P-loop containing nucleoside triphosphate hydrolase protein [Hysterangium stoloniferum]|nr:P-loop containing nucleoside triphosphate hydrolase protein [Hysterangium stoloniferum]